MKTDEIREMYLEFFESKGHTRRPSDVLVPRDDPSVLFTPAGMNQFKDHFLGKVELDYTRATTCQKCLRTGDIDNVGRTPRHHTFFEMLGNFSFGDYFKREAINWAWDFLTSDKWLKVDPSRLTVTVFHDDDEAANIWKTDIGLPDSRITRMGEDDNFWPASAPSLGPDGVCGPCSEIFYTFDDGSELEIWNLVFTQFNRDGDPPNNLSPLPSKNIDTGMGLERTAAVLQGVTTNFHIDILKPLVLAAGEACETEYLADSDSGRRLRRIADHIRACTFTIHENVEPGTKKQNYVVRRLLRRAVLDAHQLGLREPVLYQLVPLVADLMSTSYPELHQTTTRVEQEIRREEEAFRRTIDGAVERINATFVELMSSETSTIPGDRAAELYTTYGVPPELFEQLARDESLAFDWEGFHAKMKEHGETSGGGPIDVFQTGAIETLKETVKTTEFVGYEGTEATATLRGIAHRESLCDSFTADTNEDLIIVLDRTPFYAQSGGQVGDSGQLRAGSVVFQVNDTQKASDLILHAGRLLEGELHVGMQLHCEVDEARRKGLCRAHSATHLLHDALQHHVGEHAQQRGSKVEEDKLRFDFQNREQVAKDKLDLIEQEVLARIEEKAPIQFQTLPIEEARQAGATMLFGEKYPDMVRMVSIGDFSKELCGGTHLGNTSEVLQFEITSEELVSSGTRRIVALTGDRAIANQHQTMEAANSVAHLLGVDLLGLRAETERLQQTLKRLKKQIQTGKVEEARPCTTTLQRQDSSEIPYHEIRESLRETAKLLNTTLTDVPARATAMLEEIKSLEDQVQRLADREQVTPESLVEKCELVDGVRVITESIEASNPNQMRTLIDQIRKMDEPAAVLLGTSMGSGQVMLVAGLTRDLVESKISAGNWIKAVAPIVGGGGGGKPDMAQAGGKQPENLPDAMKTAREKMIEMLSTR